jgi:hypothetical protein
MNFALNFSNNLAIEYKVLETSVAEHWFEHFKLTSLDKLRPEQSIFQNFDISDEFLQAKVNRINQLVDIVNSFVDRPIDGYFDMNYPQESVNRLHVHFPEAHGEHNIYLNEYNDLIHLIEASVFERTTGRSRARMMFCHSDRNPSPIKPNEFKYFTPSRTFGDCFAHYCHVGRHPIELYYANDTNLPDDQIIPQSDISADSLFYFGSDTFHTPLAMATFRTQFKAFYRRLGESRWPYALDDPRLAVGYLPVAKIAYRPMISDQRVRNQISQCELIGFQF